MMYAMNHDLWEIYNVGSVSIGEIFSSDKDVQTVIRTLGFAPWLLSQISQLFADRLAP